MTVGRAAAFVVILAVSLAASREVIRRKHAGLPLASASAPIPRSRAPSVRPRESIGGPSAGSTPAASSAAAVPASTPHLEAPPTPNPLGEALCPEGMVLAAGTTCAETGHTCKRKDPSLPGGCAEYEPAHCRTGLELRFCIDRDEYPNREGMLPAAMVTFEEAESACDTEGKRLCTEMEWQFSCEGESGLAFGYGDVRDASACNVGKRVPSVRPEELWESRDVASVLERVDARVPSGSMPRCTSPVGARDLVGNVEEWVRSDTSSDARALRGGEYTGDPSCSAVRKLKVAGYRQFHTGFRCCRDPLVRVR
ncbi:MAG TPA: SUMF1/EgtB/PvdO family nonheme iron enzyme [Polyangiaceae bacterium]|nr:SUMF1/EgtB/PvdO family nonheme iron enzyme [Polyangiaceae bacterium]